MIALKSGVAHYTLLYPNYYSSSLPENRVIEKYLQEEVTCTPPTLTPQKERPSRGEPSGKAPRDSLHGRVDKTQIQNVRLDYAGSSVLA